MDPILNPKLKYIIQIELEGSENMENYFLIGIGKDEGKDNNVAVF